MTSKPEQVILAVLARLEAVPTAKIERNTAVPERIPAGGLVVLRDGNPGEPDIALGGFGGAYYSHDVEIELYVEEGDAAARDAAFDSLVQAVGAALEPDPTLGGLAFGTRDNIIAVMDLYPVGEQFLQKLTLQQMLLNAAKNASGLSASGISSQAEGPDTAKDAGKSLPPRRRGERPAQKAG